MYAQASLSRERGGSGLGTPLIHHWYRRILISASLTSGGDSGIIGTFDKYYGMGVRHAPL